LVERTYFRRDVGLGALRMSTATTDDGAENAAVIASIESFSNESTQLDEDERQPR